MGKTAKTPREVQWTDKAGRARVSFAWRYQEEFDRDSIGLDAWERAGFFGAYREPNRESALAKAGDRLAERGFDPALADSLIAAF